MKKFILYLVFIVLITAIFIGCATTQNYESKLNSWMGADVNNLIASWGPPSNVYVMPNGNTMYTWLWQGGTLVTSNYYMNMTFTNSVSYWCKTTFTTDNRNIIINWQWQGNSCRSN